MLLQSKPIFNVKKEELIHNLYKKGIKNPKVLKAIYELPRELFIQPMFANVAYEDRALPISENQTISQPYTVAFMTDLLDIQTKDKVLEIGTGSGYQSLVLYLMGAIVFSVERIDKLADFALSMFEKLQVTSFTKNLEEKQEVASINVFCSDGTLGLPQFAPYDKIIVTAAAPKVPEQLLRQLKIGGRMVVPVGSTESQQMCLISKKGENDYTEEYLGDFRFVPLIGQDGW